MATLSWTIPDEEYLRFLFAFAGIFGYQSMLPGRGGDPPIPNPEPVPDFIHRMQAAEWNDKIVRYEHAQLRDQVPPPASPRIQKGDK